MRGRAAGSVGFFSSSVQQIGQEKEEDVMTRSSSSCAGVAGARGLFLARHF